MLDSWCTPLSFYCLCFCVHFFSRYLVNHIFWQLSGSTIRHNESSGRPSVCWDVKGKWNLILYWQIWQTLWQMIARKMDSGAWNWTGFKKIIGPFLFSQIKLNLTKSTQLISLARCILQFCWGLLLHGSSQVAPFFSLQVTDWMSFFCIHFSPFSIMYALPIVVWESRTTGTQLSMDTVILLISQCYKIIPNKPTNSHAP